MIRGIFRLIGATSLCALACACSGPSYSHHTIDTIVDPGGGAIDTVHVSVPLGGVLKAHIVAWDSSGHRMTGGVETSNSSVMNVVNVVSGDDDWAFMGATVGHTQVQFLADGNVEHVIDADVVDSQ